MDKDWTADFGELGGTPPVWALKRPVRIAVLGDFSAGAASGRLEIGSDLAARKAIPVEFDNLEDTLARLEPKLTLPLGNDAPTYEFANAVTGGRIPREFIPSVDAGAQDAMQYGILAGFPLVGVQLTLVDGQDHEVDSAEMAF